MGPVREFDTAHAVADFTSAMTAYDYAWDAQYDTEEHEFKANYASSNAVDAALASGEVSLPQAYHIMRSLYGDLRAVYRADVTRPGAIADLDQALESLGMSTTTGSSIQDYGAAPIRRGDLDVNGETAFPMELMGGGPSVAFSPGPADVRVYNPTVAMGGKSARQEYKEASDMAAQLHELERVERATDTSFDIYSAMGPADEQERQYWITRNEAAVTRFSLANRAAFVPAINVHTRSDFPSPTLPVLVTDYAPSLSIPENDNNDDD
jgi:hypothetical protein